MKDMSKLCLLLISTSAPSTSRNSFAETQAIRTKMSTNFKSFLISLSIFSANNTVGDKQDLRKRKNMIWTLRPNLKYRNILRVWCKFLFLHKLLIFKYIY
jgi:hypothetical protein